VVVGIAERALAEEVAERLAGRAIACAESCTAGRVAAALAAVTGASSWLRGGVVAYQTEVKQAVLGVTAPSVFTPEAVAQMVTGVHRLMDADVAVATTGVLGDEPEDGMAPCTVLIATAAGGELRVATCHVDGDTPDERSTSAVVAALRAVLDHLA
jgi:nicotinamide-nucleotide amidase